MSDAATSTIAPTKLGKHLRSVRRKKGLSLSEVARGAGLSRRELVAYERGKTPIPESDLWVLAGSCGVDVGDLLPATPVPEFEAIPTSIGDMVAQLRHGRDDNDDAQRRQQRGPLAGRPRRARGPSPQARSGVGESFPPNVYVCQVVAKSSVPRLRHVTIVANSVRVRACASDECATFGSSDLVGIPASMPH